MSFLEGLSYRARTYLQTVGIEDGDGYPAELFRERELLIRNPLGRP